MSRRSETGRVSSVVGRQMTEEGVEWAGRCVWRGWAATRMPGCRTPGVVGVTSWQARLALGDLADHSAWMHSVVSRCADHVGRTADDIAQMRPFLLL